MEKINCSTPSRICLFGEHQDYLGLEVVASAINLRFKAEGAKNKEDIIRVHLSGESIDKVEEISLTEKITYRDNRDYIRSAINVLRRNGYPVEGYDIDMDSEIPIGKGMCSSTTMTVVFIKMLLELANHPHKNDPEKIAMLAFDAEVTEFKEPGGLMDHYSSAFGGLVHLTFDPDKTVVEPLDFKIPGSFILFDSLQDKDTTKVLASAKYPVLDALESLKGEGITSVRDFISNDENIKFLECLEPLHRRKLEANIDNYKVLLEGIKLLQADRFDEEAFGALLKRHHANLRDGLEISTPIIEEILETAYANGALGGKINGSGGGGCCYVYAKDEDCEDIVNAIEAKGYPAIILKQDTGVRCDS
ncbi:GHMP family kinase ATP-binding protein [Vallitalea okinawensis]|uniref:GHMP family kinase ATP-binding protein n=1 Tax=Vallitalea okinawensis TaxID=2078660 RepID=UPI000CFBE060|nr:galactokinase family protein [Vallitalea okinawensis]